MVYRDGRTYIYDPSRLGCDERPVHPGTFKALDNKRLLVSTKSHTDRVEYGLPGDYEW